MKRNLLLLTFLCSTVISFAQWKWLNPRPSGIANTQIIFTDAAHGFLFNGHGDLFKTTDAGVTWQLHQNFPFGSQMELADSTGIVIAGPSIYLSTDNGATWQQQAGFATGNINRAEIVSRDTIILLVNAGYTVPATLLVSNDRGQNWETRVASISLAGTSFDFVNSKIGYAAGGTRYTADYGIYKTIDGGITWQKMYSSTSGDFVSMKFYTANLGYAHSSFDKMLRTTDGGATWTSSDLGDNIFSIFFVNAATAWAVGEHGVVYKTTDGGANWVWASPGNRIYAHDLYSVYFFNATTGFVTGQRGRILKTTDGGLTWQEHSPFYEDVRVLSFPNPSTGYVSNGINIYKTTDAGETWAFKFSIGTTWGQNRNFNNSIFFNADTGFFTANYDAHIYKTYDGGNNWTVIYPAPASYEYVDGMSFVNSKTGYASLRTSSAWGLFKTSDAGETWKEIGSYQNFNKLHFLSEQTGYATGWYRKLFRTTDSANTWTAVLEVDRDLNALYFFNAAKGFVAGDEGYLASTIDSGHTWQPIQIPDFYGDFRSIKFADPMIGFLATDGGVMYKTIDGGLTWQAEGPNTYYNYQAIEFTKDSSVYIGGVFGSLLKNSLPAYGIDSLAITDVTSCSANFSARVIAAMSTADSVWIQYGINEFDSTLLPAQHAITNGIIHPTTGLNNLIPGAPYKIRVKILYRGSFYYSNTFFFSPNSQQVPVILANGNVLSTFVAAGGYQWYLNGIIIPGAVSRQLTATVSGVYTVKVPDPGCADVLSAGYNFTVTSTTDPALNKELRIYPNPVTDKLFFENDKLRHLSVRLTDISGRVLLITELRQSRGSVSIRQLAPGFYFIRLTDVKTKKMISRKILKL